MVTVMHCGSLVPFVKPKDRSRRCDAEKAYRKTGSRLNGKNAPHENMRRAFSIRGLPKQPELTQIPSNPQQRSRVQTLLIIDEHILVADVIQPRVPFDKEPRIHRIRRTGPCTQRQRYFEQRNCMPIDVIKPASVGWVGALQRKSLHKL